MVNGMNQSNMNASIQKVVKLNVRAYYGKM